ncbi:hypothetical protein [Acetobacter syzygii]|uniref:hypothetical protein n=1 Tax=Acetobacter syzygii TaxID=146476 RepID=UPI00157002B6|nr:hypothetical protein [Acetobacter syzygii]NSL91378.1 hypothetical protein [Acetobacter syzygii]
MPVLADISSCAIPQRALPTYAPQQRLSGVWRRWALRCSALNGRCMVVVGVALWLGMTPVYAQPQQPQSGPQNLPCGAQDGRLTLKVKELGAMVGYQWGRGTLELGGHTYQIVARGGGMLAVGQAVFQATGCVRNITRPEDFSGTYWTTGGAAVAGHGHGMLLMENAHGVDVHLSEQAQGVLMSWQVARLDMELLPD